MQTKFLLFLLLGLCSAATLVGQPIFMEQNGIVRVDVESTTSRLGRWQTRSALPGFNGTQYLEYRGSNNFNRPGVDMLEYKIRISRPGTYLFRWHSRITVAGETTDFNDSWLRAPDATEFFGERNGRFVYPKGSGRTPSPEGAGSGNWFKVYQNRANEWFWGTFTSDNDPHDIFMRFATAGDYTIQISGRSQGHALDRFILVHSDASQREAEDLSFPESARVSTSTRDLRRGSLDLSPNPTPNGVNISLPELNAAQSYQLEISDLYGRKLNASVVEGSGSSQLSVSLAAYPPGIYLLSLEADGVVYVAKVVRS